MEIKKSERSSQHKIVAHVNLLGLIYLAELCKHTNPLHDQFESVE